MTTDQGFEGPDDRDDWPMPYRMTQRMQDVVELSEEDPERAQHEADALIVALLRTIGYKGMADAYFNMRKW